MHVKPLSECSILHEMLNHIFYILLTIYAFVIYTIVTSVYAFNILILNIL